MNTLKQSVEVSLALFKLVFFASHFNRDHKRYFSFHFGRRVDTREETSPLDFFVPPRSKFNDTKHARLESLLFDMNNNLFLYTAVWQQTEDINHNFTPIFLDFMWKCVISGMEIINSPEQILLPVGVKCL